MSPQALELVNIKKTHVMCCLPLQKGGSRKATCREMQGFCDPPRVTGHRYSGYGYGYGFPYPRASKRAKDQPKWLSID